MVAATLGSDADRGTVPRLRTRRVRRGGGAPGVVQLVVLEIAAVTVGFAALAGNVTTLTVTAVAATALVAAVVGRIDGHWWYEELVVRWQMRRRKVARTRTLAGLRTADPASAALASLAPGLLITNASERGRSIGVGQDDHGWFAGVSVGSWADVSGNRAVKVDLHQLARMLDESTVPVSALQLVSHATLAPTGLGDVRSAAVTSYQELAASQGCPLDQAVWLMARLTPADAVEAAASRGGGVAGVHRALAATISRIEKGLSAAYVAHRVLDADGLREALNLSCGLELLARDGSPEAVARERWVSWSAGSLAHVSFSVTHWPAEPRPDILAALSTIPATAVSFSVGLRPHGDRVVFVGLVRVVAPADRLRAAVKQLSRATRQHGLKLRRLDGEQALAVYATAPTGGGGLW